MYGRARRPFASLCIALLAMNVLGCTYIKREDALAVIRPGGVSATTAKIIGVTLKDGRDIRFDSNSRPAIRGDSLRAEVNKQPLAIPVSDLQRVWMPSISRTRTTFLVLGLTVLVLAFAAASAAGDAVSQGGL